jgi:hypothetical protein
VKTHVSELMIGSVATRNPNHIGVRSIRVQSSA